MEKLEESLTAASEGKSLASMSVGTQAVQANSRQQEAAEASSPTEAADKELEGLAITSSIAELGYALENVSTLIFEIQELRHASASNSNTSGENSQTAEVDASLLKLEDQLEATNKEVEALQARISAYSKTSPAGMILHKWDETLSIWRKLQKEAEDMREELVEDKYLTVYRTVSRQAEDMMQSLEKIFSQCNAFVHEIYKSCGSHTKANGEELQSQINTFMTLHKSLHQKTKYYIPSCEKVLKVIDSGISQQKRSLNGEILRSHADMKLRWRNLQERMTRTEKEMQGVQELLSDLSAKATQNELQIASESALSSAASASASSRRSSTSTPSRSSVSTARLKVGDWLPPSPSRRPGESKSSDTADSPTHSRSITPFRRIANRLHRSKTNESSSPPSIPLQGSSVSSSQASGSPETQRTPLPKKTNAAALGHPTPTQSAPPMPRTVSSPPMVEKQQRRLSRLPTTGATFTPPQGPPQPSYVPSAMSERARSPLPPPRSSSSIGTATSARPPWNVGTRYPQPADLGNSLPASTSTANRGRKSMPSAGTVRSSNARYSHITSTYSQNRTQSRIFTNPSASSFRPPSPTFSASSNTSASARRSRPTSPNSRIPAPGTSAERNGTRRPQGSPQHANEDVETLYFGAPDEGAGTSLMQRALSPTPSQSAFSATSSQLGTPGGSRRKSRIPRLSLGDVPPPDPDMLGLPPPPRLPEMYSSNRSEIMTPEPALRSRAARVSAMYGRPPMSGRKSMGGVPGSMPPPSSSDFATPPHPSRSLTASTSGIRPSSRLSVGGSSAFGGFGSSAASGRRSSFYAPSTSSRLATPLPGMPDGRQPYHANKHDPLDVEIGKIINEELLVPVYCQRETPHLSKMAAESQKPSDRNAFYWIGNGDKPIHCKLVERGDRKPRKVLCKIAGEYHDLYMYLSNQQVQFEPDM